MNRNQFFCFALMLGILFFAACRPEEPSQHPEQHRAKEKISAEAENQTNAQNQEQTRTLNQGRLKVICWNVLYGFNHGKFVEAGQTWLNEQQPDVVALQELNGQTAASLAETANGWEHNHSVILKETGFPVGLTSTEPIEVVERGIDGYHHGFLHARTHDIHFFVVHFWPGKENEGRTISSKVQELLDNGQRVIVLGDFNSHSPKDAEFLKLKKKVESRFEVVEIFESQGFVDLVHKHDPNSRFSAPSPITIPRWSKDMAEVESKRQRIDFIFSGPALEKVSTGGTIIINRQVESVSDHYPVIGQFDFSLDTK